MYVFLNERIRFSNSRRESYFFKAEEVDGIKELKNGRSFLLFSTNNKGDVARTIRRKKIDQEVVWKTYVIRRKADKSMGPMEFKANLFARRRGDIHNRDEREL